MCAASEGVYRIAGVPPGEILFHIAAQPECLVCLRSGGLAVPPHKAVSVQKEKMKGKGEARRQEPGARTLAVYTFSAESYAASCGTDTTARRFPKLSRQTHISKVIFLAGLRS